MNIGSKTLLAGAIAMATFAGAAGGSLINSQPASADTATTVAAASTTANPSNGPHQVSGKTEEPLTGDTATKVKSAALAASPGATIVRMETDAEEAAYEAHITKSDGSSATIKLDSNFQVTATQAGTDRAPVRMRPTKHNQM